MIKSDEEMKKLIDYIKTDDGKYIILSIKGFNDIRQSGDNNE